jgi:hypothetical protein
MANMDSKLVVSDQGNAVSLKEIIAASSGDSTKYVDGTGAVSTPTGVTFANPSASIGSAAVNGSATTAMRSDAAPPIDQSIAPTWTGAHTFTKKVAFTTVDKGTQSAAGTLTLDFSTGNNFKATFGAGNLTIANPTNAAAGQSGILALTQDSGGSRTVTWGSNWKFSAATAPTLSTTGNAVDLISFFAVDSTHIVATLAVEDYR